MTVVSDTQVKAMVKISPEAGLGEYGIRVRTATGISELRTFYVGALPVIEEKEPNSEFATPQKIAMNVTVHGVANNEDADYFIVDAKRRADQCRSRRHAPRYSGIRPLRCNLQYETLRAKRTR